MSGSVSTRHSKAMPASAYSPGLANRSVLRLAGLTISTTRAKCSAPYG